MITSRGRFFGKTALCIGLGLVLKENGHNVGYFKPIGNKPDTGEDVPDLDAVMLKEIFEMEDDPRDICPVQVHREFVVKCLLKKAQEEVVQKIKEAFERVSSKHDVILIEGQRRNENLASIGLSNANIAKFLDSKVLIITSGEEYRVLDDIYMTNEWFKLNGADLIGVVFNNIRKQDQEQIKKDFKSTLKKLMNLETFGIIPLETKLISPTVKEIYKMTGGEILEGDNPDALGKLVYTTLIGAMGPENAIKYFQRSVNNCIVTGGDRPDLISAALEIDTTSLIVCTGGLYPPVPVLVKARERNIPIVLVPYDTNTTASMVQRVQGYISTENQPKIELSKEMVAKHLEWKALLGAL